MVKNNNRRGGDGGLKRRGLTNFLSLKRSSRRLLVRGRLFDEGVLIEDLRYRIVEQVWV